MPATSTAPGRSPEGDPAHHGGERPRIDEDRLRIVLAGLDKNVDTFAREAAHEDLTSSPEGKFFKRMAKAAWQNVTREYQTVKSTQQARQEIIESGNLLHHQGGSDESWREATINRYASDFGENLMREGETFHNLNSPEANSDSNAVRVREDVLDLVRRYAKGDIIDPESLDAEQLRTIQSWRNDKVAQEFIGQGNLLANNVTAMAEQIKAALDSAAGLDGLDREAKLEEMLSKVEVVTGEAKVGSRSEIESTASERLAAKLQNVPFLNEGRIAKAVSFVTNETMVAAMLSVGAYAAKGATAKVVAAAVIPGLGGGIIAGLRERKALHEERVLQQRRLDRGETIDENDKRQAELGETQYAARSVDELIGELGDYYTEEGDLRVVDAESFEKAMKSLAEAKARTSLYDRGKRLISFEGTGVEKFEDRRFDLDLSIAKMEVDLAKLYENDAAKVAIGLRDDEKFDDRSAEERSMVEGMLQGEMDAKDKLMRKLVIKRGLKRAAFGTLMGAGVSLGLHGIEAAVQSTVAPGVESPSGPSTIGGNNAGPTTIGGNTGPTTIGGNTGPSTIGEPGPSIIGGNTGPNSIGTETGPSTIGGNAGPDTIGGGATAPNTIGGNVGPETIGHGSHNISPNAKLVMPDGYNVQANGDHVTITGPNGKTFSDLPLAKDGSLSAQAQEQLRAGGLNIADRTDLVKGEPQVTHHRVGVSEFVRNHKDEMTHVHRQAWLEGPNELGLQNHVRDDGTIIIDIRSMTGDGSFHGASGADWHAAAREGHLSAFLSASRGSQSHAFEVPIRPDGTAEIRPGTPEAALFDGKGNYQGGFEEIGLKGGHTPDGGVKIAMLATEVGADRPTVTDTVSTPQVHAVHNYVVTETFEVAPAANAIPITEVPVTPVVPLWARRNMGQAQPGASETTTPTGEESEEAESETETPPPPPSGEEEPAPEPPDAEAEGEGAEEPEAEPEPGAEEPEGEAEPESEPPKADTTDAEGDTGAESEPEAEPEPEGTPGGEPEGEPTGDEAGAERGKPAMSEAEQNFLKDLDAEELDFPAGFDFPGMPKAFEMRERKIAARLIRQAMSEFGSNPDLVAVASRAQALAREGQTNMPGLEAMFGMAFSLLGRSLEQIRERADRRAKAESKGAGTGEAFLDDLASETGRFPYERTIPTGYSLEAKKLATRIHRAVQGKLGPVPDGRTQPQAYQNYMKKFFRQAQRIAHPDQYSHLSDEQRKLFTEAQKIFSQASAIYSR